MARRRERTAPALQWFWPGAVGRSRPGITEPGRRRERGCQDRRLRLPAVRRHRHRGRSRDLAEHRLRGAHDHRGRRHLRWRPARQGGEQFFFICFDTAGTFAYHCRIHPPQMTGTIDRESSGSGHAELWQKSAARSRRARCRRTSPPTRLRAALRRPESPTASQGTPAPNSHDGDPPTTRCGVLGLVWIVFITIGAQSNCGSPGGDAH